jgi:hypothetical protein
MSSTIAITSGDGALFNREILNRPQTKEPYYGTIPQLPKKTPVSLSIFTRRKLNTVFAA